MKMRHLFKGLIGRFTGMTKPYPEGTLVGPHVGRVEDVVETLKRANELTKKYGASMIFLDEIDRLEDGNVKLTQERYNYLMDCEAKLLENEWTPDWPTKPGWYWFYGHRYGAEMVSMNTVHVKRTASGPSRVMDGAFMYRQEKHRGVFQRIPTPVVPAEIAGGDLLA